MAEKWDDNLYKLASPNPIPIQPYPYPPQPTPASPPPGRHTLLLQLASLLLLSLAAPSAPRLSLLLPLHGDSAVELSQRGGPSRCARAPIPKPGARLTPSAAAAAPCLLSPLLPSPCTQLLYRRQPPPVSSPSARRRGAVLPPLPT
jgi:hypothetical protein